MYIIRKLCVECVEPTFALNSRKSVREREREREVTLRDGLKQEFEHLGATIDGIYRKFSTNSTMGKLIHWDGVNINYENVCVCVESGTELVTN